MPSEICGLKHKARHNIQRPMNCYKQKPINKTNVKLLFNYLAGFTFLFHNTHQ